MKVYIMVFCIVLIGCADTSDITQFIDYKGCSAYDADIITTCRVNGFVRKRKIVYLYSISDSEVDFIAAREHKIMLKIYNELKTNESPKDFIGTIIKEDGCDYFGCRTITNIRRVELDGKK